MCAQVVDKDIALIESDEYAVGKDYVLSAICRTNKNTSAMASNSADEATQQITAHTM